MFMVAFGASQWYNGGQPKKCTIERGDNRSPQTVHKITSVELIRLAQGAEGIVENSRPCLKEIGLL